MCRREAVLVYTLKTQHSSQVPDLRERLLPLGVDARVKTRDARERPPRRSSRGCARVCARHRSRSPPSSASTPRPVARAVVVARSVRRRVRRRRRRRRDVAVDAERGGDGGVAGAVLRLEAVELLRQDVPLLLELPRALGRRPLPRRRHRALRGADLRVRLAGRLEVMEGERDLLREDLDGTSRPRATNAPPAPPPPRTSSYTSAAAAAAAACALCAAAAASSRAGGVAARYRARRRALSRKRGRRGCASAAPPPPSRCRGSMIAPATDELGGAARRSPTGRDRSEGFAPGRIEGGVLGRLASLIATPSARAPSAPPGSRRARRFCGVPVARAPSSARAAANAIGVGGLRRAHRRRVDRARARSGAAAAPSIGRSSYSPTSLATSSISVRSDHSRVSRASSAGSTKGSRRASMKQKSPRSSSSSPGAPLPSACIGHTWCTVALSFDASERSKERASTSAPCAASSRSASVRQRRTFFDASWQRMSRMNAAPSVLSSGARRFCGAFVTASIADASVCRRNSLSTCEFSDSVKSAEEAWRTSAFMPRPLRSRSTRLRASEPRNKACISTMFRPGSFSGTASTAQRRRRLAPGDRGACDRGACDDGVGSGGDGGGASAGLHNFAASAGTTARVSATSSGLGAASPQA